MPICSTVAQVVNTYCRAGALKTMEGVFLGPQRKLDAALAEIETRTRGVCRQKD
jgi:hypothetical protein